VAELEPTYTDMQRRLGRLDPRTERDDIERLQSEIAALEHEQRQLTAERSKRSAARDNAEQIKSQLENWLGAFEMGGIKIGGALRAAKVRSARLDGESIKDSLLRVRSEIANVKGEIIRTQRAPLPAADIKREVERRVKELAERGRPILNLDDGKVGLTFADMPMFSDTATALSAPPGSATALLCWLFGRTIIESLTSGLDGIEGGLSSEQRGDKLAKLDRELLQRELAEESLVVAALAQGLECHRRTSANPLAIFVLEVAASVPEPEVEQVEAAE
jgi:hypothetical protein